MRRPSKGISREVTIQAEGTNLAYPVIRKKKSGTRARLIKEESNKEWRQITLGLVDQHGDLEVI